MRHVSMARPDTAPVGSGTRAGSLPSGAPKSPGPRAISFFENMMGCSESSEMVQKGLRPARSVQAHVHRLAS